MPETPQSDTSIPNVRASLEMTVHKEGTVYSYKTPHKFPDNIPEFKNLTNLSQQLYPTGRAFYMPEGGDADAFHFAINEQILKLMEDAYDLTSKRFPDSPKFDEVAIKYWEWKYGLMNPNSLSLAVMMDEEGPIEPEDIALQMRRDALLRKMAFPNGRKYRQTAAYMQNVLRGEGFNVSVHENAFYTHINVNGVEGGWYYKTVQQVTGEGFYTAHGPSVHGGVNHGGVNHEVIANKISPNEEFDLGEEENIWATFFISGIESISTPAVIPSYKKRQFRELVLKLKPAHLVAILIK